MSQDRLLVDEPLISIIVPVYNVERYLDRCVFSIIGQTYHNLEIILIDDGSPDNCPNKCDEWAGRDARVTVVHQQNAGVSSARNNGLDKAHGEYIYFVDADDYVEPNLIEILVNRMRADNAQIVFCGYETNALQSDGSLSKADETKSYDMTFHDNSSFAARFADLAAERYAYPSWNKLFRMDFIRAIGSRFPVGVVADEDSYFDFPLYAAADRVSVVPNHLYHYVVRTGSAAGRYQPALFQSHKVVWEFVSPIIAQWNPSFSAVFDNLFLTGMGLCLNFLYEDRTLTRSYRREQVRNIVQNAEVQEFVQGLRPAGFRNRIVSACMRWGTVPCCCYGWSIAVLKRFRHS